MKETGRLARPLAWLKDRAPGVHRFLVRDDKPYPLVREALGVFVFLSLLATVLWGATGQPFLQESPVVVVESGSMMHCAGTADKGRECERAEDVPYGRFGTIDPGDLIFVRDVEATHEVEPWAEAVGRCDAFTPYRDCACDGREGYGACGDVIIFQKSSGFGTPIIHRAMAYLEVHGDGTYSVDLPESWGCTDIVREPLSGLQDECLARMGFATLHNRHEYEALGPEDSGFLTRGDNNNGGDQSGENVEVLPVRTSQIIGKARGELPWLGLVKLFASDLTTGTSNYRDASPDPKVLMWITLGLIIAAPVLVENGAKLLRKNDEPE